MCPSRSPGATQFPQNKKRDCLKLSFGPIVSQVFLPKSNKWLNTVCVLLWPGRRGGVSLFMGRACLFVLTFSVCIDNPSQHSRGTFTGNVLAEHVIRVIRVKSIAFVVRIPGSRNKVKTVADSLSSQVSSKKNQLHTAATIRRKLVNSERSANKAVNYVWRCHEKVRQICTEGRKRYESQTQNSSMLSALTRQIKAAMPWCMVSHAPQSANVSSPGQFGYYYTTVLPEVGSLLDFVFIQFYNNARHPSPM